MFGVAPVDAQSGREAKAFARQAPACRVGAVYLRRGDGDLRGGFTGESGVWAEEDAIVVGEALAWHGPMRGLTGGS